jgi:hypothetical protein
MEYYGCPPDVLVSLQACTPGGRLGVCPPSTGHLGSEAFCMCACDNHYTFDTAGFAAQRADEACVLSRLIFLRLLHLELYIVWKNGMCGLEDHDCRARMQARQGRVGSNRTTEQQNINKTKEYHRHIGRIWGPCDREGGSDVLLFIFAHPSPPSASFQFI